MTRLQLPYHTIQKMYILYLVPYDIGRTVHFVPSTGCSLVMGGSIKSMHVSICSFVQYPIKKHFVN